MVDRECILDYDGTDSSYNGKCSRRSELVAAGGWSCSLIVLALQWLLLGERKGRKLCRVDVSACLFVAGALKVCLVASVGLNACSARVSETARSMSGAAGRHRSYLPVFPEYPKIYNRATRHPPFLDPPTWQRTIANK